jgi:hypothetical protein
MGMVVLNGKEFADKESLLQDVDFQGLDEHTKSLLLNKLDPNEPILPPPQNTVPLSVTPRQIRTALVLSGISLSSIEAIIDSLPSPNKEIALIAWEYSVEFQRNNPLINQLAPLLGLSSKQIDDIFILASTL